jgi:acylphosphatase
MNEAVDDATLRLRITGKVQGVWFRGWAVKTARGLGLAGWVRNRHDGAVEALIHGPHLSLEAMVFASRQGPPAARVTEVAVEKALASGEDLAGGFTQRPTS